MKNSTFKLPDLTRREYLLWFLRKRKRFTVVNVSMFPILRPGDTVLMDRKAYQTHMPEIGDIVVAWHAAKKDLKIIKRVTAVFPSGELNLQGENPFESTDFNRVPMSKIIGKVTCMFLSAEEKNPSNSNHP